MTGSDIVYELLTAHAPLTAMAPIDRIACGRLGQVELPAVLIRTISSIERIRSGNFIHVVDRVSVTVRAANYDDQCVLLDHVTAAATGRSGAFAGSPRATVLTAGRGPDVWGPADSYEQAQDFRVSFDRPAQPGD